MTESRKVKPSEIAGVDTLSMPASDFKATLRGLLQTPPPPKRIASKAKKKK